MVRVSQGYQVVWARDYRGKDIVGRPRFSPFYRTVVSNSQASTYRSIKSKWYYKSEPPYKPGVDYGRWQAVKSKVLFLLVLAAVESGGVLVEPPRKPGYRERYLPVNDCSGSGINWLTVSMLALYSGEKASSLYVLMPRWCEWGYVERQVIVGSYHNEVWGYRILYKGVLFVDRFANYILPMDRYKSEMQEAQRGIIDDKFD